MKKDQHILINGSIKISIIFPWKTPLMALIKNLLHKTMVQIFAYLVFNEF